MEICANPGCDQPGTNKCSGCKVTHYCGPICQKEHWVIHKESCDGRLRKMGMDHLNKAKGFHREQNNWPQALHHSDIAATKLMQLKDRPLEAISKALDIKVTALGFLGRHREQMDCAKKWYTLWNTKPTDMGAIRAAFALIESCIQNNEFEDAKLYASTLLGIINHQYDNKIPEDQRQRYIAEGSYYLAAATLRLAQAGGIPPEQKQRAGHDAIAGARKALEIHTQLYGTEHERVANDMSVLAEALDFFNDVDDDDEVLRLFQRAIDIYRGVYGNSTVNVAVVEGKLGDAYQRRAKRAAAVCDVERYATNLELALPRYLEAIRIFRALNREDNAGYFVQHAAKVELYLRQLATSRASANIAEQMQEIATAMAEAEASRKG